MSDELPEGFEADFPDTEETGGGKFGPLPEGLYKVNIADIKLRQHERGPMFGLMLRVTDGEKAKRVIWTNVIFLPYYQTDGEGKLKKNDKGEPVITKGAGIARNFLKSILQPYKGGKIRIEPKLWKGQSCGVRIIIKSGTEFNNVVGWYTLDALEAEQKKSSEVNELPEEAIF